MQKKPTQEFILSFDAFLFDLDGTLLQGSDRHYEKCVRAVGQQFGIADIAVTRGMSLRVFLHRNFPEFSEEKTEKFIQAYREIIPKIERDVSFFPDAQKFLDFTDRNHIPKALVTNCSDNELRETRKHIDLDQIFPELIYSNGIIACKPAPDMFLKAAENLGKQPKNCLVFEDSTSGIAAAKTAGMTVIALDRHGDLGDFSGADFLISSFVEIL